MRQATSSIKATGDLPVNIKSFSLHLKAENLSARTIETYLESIEQLARFLADQGMPQDVANIRREHVEAFIAHLLELWKPATANNRFRDLTEPPRKPLMQTMTKTLGNGHIDGSACLLANSKNQ